MILLRMRIGNLIDSRFKVHSPWRAGRGLTEMMNETVVKKHEKEERELFVEGWEFMQTLGEGAYGE